MTEEQEDAAYVAQQEWILKHYGQQAHNLANYGWFVDEIEETIGTKIYGVGYLITHVPTLRHTFQALA